MRIHTARQLLTASMISTISLIPAMGVLSVIGTTASAGIATYTSSTSLIGDVTNFADFNGLVNDQSLLGYQEDGLGISANRTYYSWDAPGLDGSEMFYPSTGALELVNISLVSGDDFNDLDMQVSSGWSPNGPAAVYLWIQAFSAGSLVGEFDLDVMTGDYVGLSGGGFDLVRIGSYVNADLRGMHDENLRNAIAIDNLSAGAVPTPGTLMLPMVTMLTLGGRRRQSRPI